MDIRILVDNFITRKTALGKIIKPIIRDYNLEVKELIEACQVAKFILKLGVDISITAKPKPPAPDFILNYNSRLIGLEHTRLFTDNANEYHRIISFFKYAEKVYKKEHPTDFFQINIELKDDFFEYAQNNKKSLADEIVTFIYCFKNAIPINKPSYISEVRIYEAGQFSINYIEQNNSSPNLTRQRLIEAIKKKEDKISLYNKSDINITSLWLILIVGSNSSVSYQIDEYVDYKYESRFDRVFLISDFNEEVVIVK